MAPPSNNDNKRPKFSFAYSRFVVDPDEDLLEIIAYALYKRAKADWIQGQRAIGKEPTGPEIVRWSDEQSTPENIEKYKKSAVKTLSRLERGIEARIKPILREELIPEVRKEMTGVNAQKVVSIDATLARITAQVGSGRTFLSNVVVGVCASFFYSVILVLLYIIVRLFGNPFPPLPRGDSRPSELKTPTPQVPEKIVPKVAVPR